MTKPNPSYINLPHAHTIVGRLVYYLAHRPEAAMANEAEVDARDLLDDLEKSLRAYEVDPPMQDAVAAAERLCATARELSDEIVHSSLRGDRLGQCVRNLFECLGYPDEGAERSLACGERPDSPLRP